MCISPKCRKMVPPPPTTDQIHPWRITIWASNWRKVNSPSSPRLPSRCKSCHHNRHAQITRSGIRHIQRPNWNGPLQGQASRRCAAPSALKRLTICAPASSWVRRPFCHPLLNCDAHAPATQEAGETTQISSRGHLQCACGTVFTHRRSLGIMRPRSEFILCKLARLPTIGGPLPYFTALYPDKRIAPCCLEAPNRIGCLAS